MFKSLAVLVAAGVLAGGFVSPAIADDVPFCHIHPNDPSCVPPPPPPECVPYANALADEQAAYLAQDRYLLGVIAKRENRISDLEDKLTFTRDQSADRLRFIHRLMRENARLRAAR